MAQLGFVDQLIVLKKMTHFARCADIDETEAARLTGADLQGFRNGWRTLVKRQVQQDALTQLIGRS